MALREQHPRRTYLRFSAYVGSVAMSVCPGSRAFVGEASLKSYKDTRSGPIRVVTSTYLNVSQVVALFALRDVERPFEALDPPGVLGGVKGSS